MPRSPRRGLLAAAAFVVTAAVIWVAAFRTAAGARIDEAALADLLRQSGSRSESLATTIAHLGDPGPVALVTAGIIAVALLRRRPLLAVAAGVVIAGANLTTQALKVLTAEPRAIESLPAAHIAAKSWPSGHATASMSVAFCLVAVVPSGLRTLAAALGGGVALCIACSVMILGWHLPSDVLGGICVAGAWMLTALAILRRPEASAGAATRRSAPVRIRRWSVVRALQCALR